MKTPRRIAAGTTLGVLAASLATPALGFFTPPGQWDFGPLLYVVAMPVVMAYTAAFAGPGALLLAWIHAVLMEAWAPKARSVRHLRYVGMLLGLPLGVANLLLAYRIILLCGLHPDPLWTMVPWVIPALAGGAGLGWGVTVGLTPGRAARVRTPARPRPRRIRRDGPPFFDNRRVA